MVLLAPARSTIGSGMTVQFAHPLLLLVIVPVLALGLAMRLTLGRPSSPRAPLWAALYVGSVVLVALALAQPRARSSSRPVTVLVIDRSASIDANMETTENRWAAEVAHGACPQPCRVIRFAGAAAPVRPSAAALNGGGPQAVGSDLGSALAVALARVPSGGRIVVLSDGWITSQMMQSQIAAARLKHVSIDPVVLSDPKFRYAAVTQVQAPAAVHAGDAVPVRVTLRSSVTEPVTLYLVRDGVALGQQTVSLHPGDNPLLLSYTASKPGWHSYQIRIVLFSDDLAENNERGATVDVVAPPRVLVVSPSPSPISATLTGLGFTVTTIAPQSLPANPSALAGTDAVVLDDVPATTMSAAQMSALAAAVRDGGLGVFALGGPHSFSLGRYAHTPLDTLLPVSSLVPGNLQRKNVAIELVLDHSGSMIDLAGGVPKIQMVHVAGTQTAKFVAAHHDSLGIVDFDIAPHTLVPMQALSTGAQAKKAISAVSRLQADGGTDIYAGLQAGLVQLEKSSAPDKHLILMTDGISQPENYTPLLAALSRDHIQVATVALGNDADKSLLYNIARDTGGHYYFTNNAHQLPLIFGKETRFDVKPVKVSGRLTVTPGSDSPVVRSLAGRTLPPLTGNVVTNLKSGAQADLLAAGSGAEPNPAMAEWQYGAGRVVAFTPGLGPPWAGAWAGRTTLVNDAVRWAQRGVSSDRLIPTVLDGAPPTLQLDLAQSPAAAAVHPGQITATLTSTTGRSDVVALRAVAPALYQAPLPGFASGIYHFSIDAGPTSGATSTGLIAVPYSMEYLPRPADDTPMGPLAVLTGGHALAPGDPAVLTGGGWRSVWWIPAIAGLVLFLAGALGRTLERASAEPDGGRPDGSGEPDGSGGPGGRYSAISPADLAASASTSSGETSVGART
jgi:Ca-activated chloride channel homolog